jgi:hypothetical protein
MSQEQAWSPQTMGFREITVNFEKIPPNSLKALIKT